MPDKNFEEIISSLGKNISEGTKLCLLECEEVFKGLNRCAQFELLRLLQDAITNKDTSELHVYVQMGLLFDIPDNDLFAIKQRKVDSIAKLADINKKRGVIVKKLLAECDEKSIAVLLQFLQRI